MVKFSLSWVCIPLICLLLTSACLPRQPGNPKDPKAGETLFLGTLEPGALNRLIDFSTVTTFNFDYTYSISQEEMAHWLDQLDELYRSVEIDHRFYHQGLLISYGFSAHGCIEITIDKDAEDYQEFLDYLAREIIPRLNIADKPVPVLIKKGSPPILAS